MSRRLGADAETAAAAHLERLGYRIVARNVTARGGELDLVALDRGTLCFIEVRARGRRDFGAAHETIGPVKRQRIAFAAEQFLTRWRDPATPCRFDVVTIEPDGIRVIQDAFDAP